jgi:hypothetical protein
MRWWTLRFSLTVKDLEQTGQMWGRWPVWVRWWRASRAGTVKCLPQASQGNCCDWSTGSSVLKGGGGEEGEVSSSYRDDRGDEGEGNLKRKQNIYFLLR